ncbi:uncharacterized protein EV420DRAFT_1486646 [Desarmillaria tabescens]|uniref:Uncharacterized protein n=1 Tax=Armillaria tabescens TaxID=1929756 RepID=A0AA39J9C0_ARMTA|nr:uncharacterized protein EV420DRAFT_1486646 [Desarmillaria tabescens]KAK0438532.1 hypothetical protein EV420DRAFT_1486646 [Desarmillaria tabescens]
MARRTRGKPFSSEGEPDTSRDRELNTLSGFPGSSFRRNRAFCISSVKTSNEKANLTLTQSGRLSLIGNSSFNSHHHSSYLIHIIHDPLSHIAHTALPRHGPYHWDSVMGSAAIHGGRWHHMDNALPTRRSASSIIMLTPDHRSIATTQPSIFPDRPITLYGPDPSSPSHASLGWTSRHIRSSEDSALWTLAFLLAGGLLLYQAPYDTEDIEDSAALGQYTPRHRSETPCFVPKDYRTLPSDCNTLFTTESPNASDSLEATVVQSKLAAGTFNVLKFKYSYLFNDVQGQSDLDSDMVSHQITSIKTTWTLRFNVQAHMLQNHQE